MTILSKRLRDLTTKRNFTQKRVAEGSGIPPETYRRYANGKREPSASLIVALADFFNVSTDYLLGRTDNPNMMKGA